MKLIPISDNVLINPDQIESVEIRELNGEKTFIIFVGGRVHIPTVKIHDLMRDLVSSGVDLTKQFTAV